MRVATTSVALALLAATPASAATVRVAADGGGDHLTIQAGVDAAIDGDEVVVAPGTYAGDVDLGGRTLTLRGEGGSATTFIVGTGNGPAVRASFGFEARPVLQGFDISGGAAHGIAEPFGGCVRATRSALVLRDLVLHDCTARDGGGLGLDDWSGAAEDIAIHATHAVEDAQGGHGGGLWLKDSVGSLDRVVVRDTTADREGGGVYVGGGSPALNRLRVARSTAMWGGGVMLSDTQARLERVVLTGNETSQAGAGLAAYAGGAPVVRQLQAYANRNLEGPLGYTSGGGGLWADGASLTVVSAAIALNRADGFGGGIGATDAGLTLDRLVVAGNTASDSAGLGIVYGAAFSLRRARVTNNDSDDMIGGGYFLLSEGVIEGVVFDSADSSWDSGCARLACEACEPGGERFVIVRNTVFDDCRAHAGAALSVREGEVRLEQLTVVRSDPEDAGGALLLEAFGDPVALDLTGSIVADGSDGVALEIRENGQAVPAASVSWSLLEPGPDGRYVDPDQRVTQGAGVIDGDPLFQGTDIAEWGSYLRLAPGSDAIDAGDPIGATDPDGTIADLGAFGGPGATLWSEGDSDGDGVTVWERDCDDLDPRVHPGATEVCNCVDDDCDFLVDEGGCPDPCAPADWIEAPLGDDDDSAAGDDDDSTTGDDDDSATGDDDDSGAGSDDDDGGEPAVGCLVRCDVGDRAPVDLRVGLVLGLLALLRRPRRYTARS